MENTFSLPDPMIVDFAAIDTWNYFKVSDDQNKSVYIKVSDIEARVLLGAGLGAPVNFTQESAVNSVGLDAARWTFHLRH